MAVIREKQQFRNSRIGVVRMDTGESQMWQTVASAADSLTQQAFKQASVEAQNKGKEFAESVGEESLRTIDPATGKPQAFKAPTSFGTIAQAAYEETLDRRYIRTVEREIQDKANETYIKYENDPQGVEKYSQVMEDYVGGMTKNADKRFEGIVRDTGAAYIASTKFNLMQKRNLRIKEAEQIAQRDDADEVASLIESMAENVNWSLPDSQGHRDVEDMYMEGVAGQRVANQSGLLSDAQFKENVGIMRRALPKAILSKMINFDAVYEKEDGSIVQINSDVALVIENSLKTNRVLNEVPTALKPQVQRIIDSEAYDKDRANILRKVTELRTNLSLKEKDAVKITAQQEANARVYTGQKVDPTDSLNKKAFDNLIVQGNKNLSSQQFPNLIEYYLSEESLSDGNIYALVERQNLFGEQFISALKMGAGANTGWTKENYQVALTHFETFTNVNILGSPANKLNQFLSPDEMAFYRSLSSLTKQDGSQENLLQNVAKLNAVNDDPARLNDRLGKIFETDKPRVALKDFLNDAFPANRRMQEMARPLVELMAFTGSNVDQIKTQLLGMYENQYVKTNGIVIDISDPDLDRSIFAPHVLLGSDDLRSFYINGTTYINSISDGGYILSENPVGKAKNKVVRLYPTTINAAQPDIIQYEYTIQDGDEEKKRTGQLQTFQYMAVTVQENGEITPILDKRTGSPIYIGTEIAQTEIMENAQRAKQAELDEQNRKVQRQLEADIEFERLEGISSP